MMIKLLIGVGVLLVGVAVFMPQTAALFPDAATVLDSVRNEAVGIGGDVAEQVRGVVDGTLDAVNVQIEGLRGATENILG